MSEADQIAGLESALLERASKLAEEYLAHGRQDYDRVLAEAKQRLHADEERELAAAKGQAERIFQQQTQAAELQLQAELDGLRLELVSEVLAHLPARLERLALDDKRYLPLLEGWLHEGAQVIEHNELIVQANARDLPRLKRGWDRIAQEAAPGKHLTLATEPMACTGGIFIESADHNIRVDNTFEGRLERLGEQLQTAIAEHLMSVNGPGGN